ncbi:flagellar basal body P-ring formation chaperone FlgA [Candidatus Photodesmus blepharus]|uniref:flagellar basal body P-ring formation chaperone FlgA n=1 Tax=Candidatus Photodesmus blepharonis TaxID=1179155 RepID=UPI002A4E29CA|nr:flagellar basal body P-ring formation chaperone FlgA [Candidatus Photodesmus blepharus]
MLLFLNFFAHSATNEQIQAIQQAAENYVINHIERSKKGKLDAKAASLDPRIFATDCPSPLSVYSPPLHTSSNNVTVLVQCKEDNWKAYIPVRIISYTPKIIATKLLYRGHIISSKDVRISMVNLHRFQQRGFSSLNMVIGAKIKRNLYKGNIIELKDICVVCRNQKITIKVVKKNITITVNGIAIADGVIDEQVKVKNTKSNRIIEGIVTGVKEVTVRL